MKKLFCILLALVMLLCVAACGEEESSGRKNKDKDKDKTSSVQDNREKVETIIGGTSFAEGIALVATGYNSDTQKDKYAIIDTEGHILSEFEHDRWQYGLTYMDRFINGVIVSEYDVLDKKGKFVATAEDKGFSRVLSDARTGKILVANDYSSTVSFGVLDTKGEWIEPLSSSHPIAEFITDLGIDTTTICFNNFVSDEVIQVAEGCYYNMVTGEVTKYHNNYVNEYATMGDGRNTCLVNRVVEYDKTETIAMDVYLSYKGQNGFIGYYYTGEVSPDAYCYFDYQGNEIIKFDASYVYEIAEVKGYIIARIMDNERAFKTCIYKANGEKVAGNLDVNYSMTDVDIYPEHNMFSIQDNYFTFDGEKIEFEDYTFGSFGEGLFYARDDDYNNCYINLKGKKVIG